MPSKVEEVKDIQRSCCRNQVLRLCGWEGEDDGKEYIWRSAGANLSALIDQSVRDTPLACSFDLLAFEDVPTLPFYTLWLEIYQEMEAQILKYENST